MALILRSRVHVEHRSSVVRPVNVIFSYIGSISLQPRPLPLFNLASLLITFRLIKKRVSALSSNAKTK